VAEDVRLGRYTAEDAARLFGQDGAVTGEESAK
jgi:hypothetical protein